MTILCGEEEFYVGNVFSFFLEFPEAIELFEKEHGLTISSLDFDYDKLFDLTDSTCDTDIISYYLEKMKDIYTLDYDCDDGVYRIERMCMEEKSLTRREELDKKAIDYCGENCWEVVLQCGLNDEEQAEYNELISSD